MVGVEGVVPMYVQFTISVKKWSKESILLTFEDFDAWPSRKSGNQDGVAFLALVVSSLGWWSLIPWWPVHDHLYSLQPFWRKEQTPFITIKLIFLRHWNYSLILIESDFISMYPVIDQGWSRGFGGRDMVKGEHVKRRRGTEKEE